jgi:hypothetical protein
MTLTLQTEMRMIPGRAILRRAKLVYLRFSRLYDRSVAPTYAPLGYSYLARTLRDSRDTVLMIGLELTQSMPVNSATVVVVGEIIVHANTCTRQSYTCRCKGRLTDSVPPICFNRRARTLSYSGDLVY